MQASSILAAQHIVQRTIPTLERQLDDAIAGRPPLIDLVLSQVQMIDSIGLNWMLSVQARVETLGTRIRLLDPSPVVLDILTATRLDVRFDVKYSADLNGGANGRQ